MLCTIFSYSLIHTIKPLIHSLCSLVHFKSCSTQLLTITLSLKFPWKATKQQYNKKYSELHIRFQLVRLCISITEENILPRITLIDVIVIFQMCRGCFHFLYTLWKLGIFDVLFLSTKGALTFEKKQNQTKAWHLFSKEVSQNNPADFFVESTPS